LWNVWGDDDLDAPETETGNLAMTRTTQTLPAETGSTEITRFNALRHSILSRYAILPWEDADEYQTIVAALVAEHAPQGPTEEHLVEELAGILWRKRRLRLAEAAAHRHGLDDSLSPFGKTVKVALVNVDAEVQSEWVVDAIRTTTTETEEEIREMQEDEAMTWRAMKLLSNKRNDAYEAALAASEVLIAIPDPVAQRNLLAIEVPRLGSFIASGTRDAKEVGLDAFPPENRR